MGLSVVNTFRGFVAVVVEDTEDQSILHDGRKMTTFCPPFVLESIHHDASFLQEPLL
jgi:hypothetical protein